MSGIFISYRKEDSRAWAIHLRDHLARAFGQQQIFLDVDSIGAGQWRAQIEAALDRCRVVLVLIGPRWAGSLDESGRTRLSLPDDVHRVEIATALRRPAVTVIPVLVDGARLPPRSQLPEDLQGLLDRQAREIGDAHDRRVAELRRLTRTIDDVTGRRRLRARALTCLSASVAVGFVNALVAAGSRAAALAFLAVAAMLAVVSWQTYRSMAREDMRGAWIALLAVILSCAMSIGSLIRLAIR